MFKYKELFTAVCSECSLKFKISAEPVANKPIYCQDCYWHRKQALRQIKNGK